MMVAPNPILSMASTISADEICDLSNEIVAVFPSKDTVNVMTPDILFNIPSMEVEQDEQVIPSKANFTDVSIGYDFLPLTMIYEARNIKVSMRAFLSRC